MGCCISKYKPKKTHSLEECYSHVQDKLVISQQAIATKTTTTPNILVSKKISPCCPPSPPTCSSSSNISSFTCTTSNSTTDSCSSSLSSTSRSFSNEFLWSCVKENPHIIRINSIKEASLALSTRKVQGHKLDSRSVPLKQSTPQRVINSTPQKRVRSSSPTTLTRQKSFRREPTADQRWLHSSYSSSSRTLRSPSPSRRFSPSPSRRFSGDNNKEFAASTPKESCNSKRMVGAKVNASNSVSVSSYLRKENFRPASPSTTSMGLRLALRNRETCTHRIGSKIDETAVREALAHHDQSDSIPMEDIDNPLIALDCFIFL